MNSARVCVKGVLAVAALCTALLGSTAVAQSRLARPIAKVADAGPGEISVNEWLLHTHEGSRRRAYVGTFVVSVGDYMSSARIWHVCDGTQQMERVDTLTGTPRSTLRRDNEVMTFWPTTRVAVAERRAGMGAFPNWVDSANSDIDQFYKVGRIGTDRVAGYDSEIVFLRPVDKHRFGYRVWSEKKSGLIVKLQTLDTSGNILEQSAFSELALNAPVSARELAQMMGDTAGYRVQKPSLLKTSDVAEGWSMSKTVPGFKTMNFFNRTLAANSGDEVSREQVFQWVFSDGLASVSLFVGIFDPARHSQSGAYAIGATHTLTRRIGKWWVTAVGEVPETTLNSFVSGLERRK
jgi:sigma-E factor negative regulatory protein RseB